MKATQIKKDIESKAKVAVFNTREKIYSVIEKNLRVYYGEYRPKEYIRTQQLLNSLVRQSSGLHAEVYFDAGALNYENGVMELQHTSETGVYGWATWGAAEVLDTSMHGSHGGYVSGTAIWDNSMSELGDIIALIVKELRAAGLPVH